MSALTSLLKQFRHHRSGAGKVLLILHLVLPIGAYYALNWGADGLTIAIAMIFSLSMLVMLAVG